MESSKPRTILEHMARKALEHGASFAKGFEQGKCDHEYRFSLTSNDVTCGKCGLIHPEYAYLDSIHVGHNRSRIISNINPLDPEFIALVNSLRDDGLLEPIVIDKESNLLAGNRRYAAAKLLGWKTIRVTVKDVQQDDTERDMIALIENLIRSEPSPADYAECFLTVRDKLVAEKGMRARMAEYYIASRVGWSIQRVHALIRIKERLIPKLFLAFRGVGGLALTQGEAAAYAGLPKEDQEAAYQEWRGMGGRKALRGDENDAPVRPVQPHQSVEKLREELRKLESASYRSDSLEYAYIRTLRWVLSTSSKPPWET